MHAQYLKASMASMLLDEQALAELKKIDGFQIASEMSMSMMGTKITAKTEVVELSEKIAPPHTYSVPEGYVKREKLSLTDLQLK
jgi:hypothetical protein